MSCETQTARVNIGARNLNVILLTYGTAAIGYLLLTASQLVHRQHMLLARGSLLATAATAGWAFVIAIGSTLPDPPIGFIQFTELAKNAFWLFLVLQLLGLQSSKNVWRWGNRSWAVPFFVALLACIAVIGTQILSRRQAVDAPYLYDLVMFQWVFLAVVGLLLIEQLYRNASEEERWGLKFLCLGLGVMCAYDLLMYAQALLFRQLDGTLWQARGVVHVLVLPWLGVAIKRRQNWRLDLHVSRHVVFHTVTLMGAGLYLLCMAVVGYFIKYLGGTWGGVLQISFLAAGGALLLTLLFSGTLRARLRVWLSKHFFAYRYDYRVEWLRFTEGLAALENTSPGIIRILASITMSPGGLLLHRDTNEQLSELATWSMDPPESEDLGNLAVWMGEKGWIVDLHEWRASPDLYVSLNLPQWLRDSEKLWLVVPLVFQDQVEGLVFLARTDVKKSLNWEDRDLLKTAGRQAAALLAQQRANQALVEARQFDAFNRLSAYVIHDLKNILAQQSLMVANARKHRDKPEFINDMIRTVENSVDRMQSLMDQMRSGLRGTEISDLSLATLLRSIIENHSRTKPVPVLNADTDVNVTADRERLSTVFSHLIQNAQEATEKDGEVSINLAKSNASAVVTIRDTGCGMTREFIRDRLFKPFESTKGLTGMGIGVFESREYIRQIGGEISVSSRPGLGSEFKVHLPIVDHNQQHTDNTPIP